MKKHIILLFIGILALSSCIKTDSTDFEAEARIQFGKDTVIINKFLLDNNITAVRHPSGLYYKIIESGTGNVQYTANTQVKTKYTGRLLNGTVFDKTENDETFNFQLGGNVIYGWKIGVQLLQKNGKIRLFIPSY